MQVNLDRSKRAMDLFIHRCTTENTDLGIIAEPNKNMTKYSSKWITDEKIDTAIYAPHKNLSIRKSGHGKGYTWIETDELAIYSCYVPPPTKVEEFQHFLHELKISITQHNKEVLIGGDFNAKAHTWGSTIEDQKGNALAEWASEMDYVILNDGGTPTFERNGGKSYIDVTMCSSKLSPSVDKWYITKLPQKY